MSSFPIPERAIQEIGWTLVHFLWQGTVVAALFACARVVFRDARTRYAAGCISLLLMAALPILTLQTQDLRPDSAVSWSPLPIVAPERGDASPSPNSEIPDLYGTIPPIHSISTNPVVWPPVRRFLQDHMTAIVTGYLVGVAILLLRLIGGCVVTGRMRRTGIKPMPEPWTSRIKELTHQLGLGSQVRVLLSSLANVPMVVGVLRPVVLVPTATLLGLTRDELESILVHEFAHIRRYDNVVNILQRVVEVFFFYHPAVWWVSECVRAEREHCCDDVAAAFADKRLYAGALAELEAVRRPYIAATASTQTSLQGRITRLLSPDRRGDSGAPDAMSSLAAAGLALAAALLLVFSVPLHSTELDEIIEGLKRSEASLRTFSGTEVIDMVLYKKGTGAEQSPAEEIKEVETEFTYDLAQKRYRKHTTFTAGIHIHPPSPGLTDSSRLTVFDGDTLMTANSERVRVQTGGFARMAFAGGIWSAVFASGDLTWGEILSTSRAELVDTPDEMPGIRSVRVSMEDHILPAGVNVPSEVILNLDAARGYRPVRVLGLSEQGDTIGDVRNTWEDDGSGIWIPVRSEVDTKLDARAPYSRARATLRYVEVRANPPVSDSLFTVDTKGKTVIRPPPFENRDGLLVQKRTPEHERPKARSAKAPSRAAAFRDHRIRLYPARFANHSAADSLLSGAQWELVPREGQRRDIIVDTKSPIFTERQIFLASGSRHQRNDPDGTVHKGPPMLTIELDNEGTERLVTYTSRPDNIGQPVAMQYNGRWVAFPSLRNPMRDGRTVFFGLTEEEVAAIVEAYGE